MNEVKGIAFTESLYAAQREWKTFAASDGSFTEQVITHIGAGLEANAIEGDEHQRRSFPDNGGLWASAGYEFVRGMDLAGNAERIASEAVELLSAPAAARGHAHDRAPPEPAVHAGPRELRPPDRARPRLRHRGQLRRHQLPDAGHAGRLPLRLGPRATSSPTRPSSAAWARSAGTTRASQAQRADLVKDGMFVGYLSSRETAPRIGRESGGAMRADGWNRIPLIRMTNVNLLPRDGMTFEDIVADTDDGLLFETNRSWSIDDRRLNFQFSTEVCREIKGGKPGKLYRNGDLHRHHLRAVALDGRRRRRLELADVGHAELRQGRAGADRPRGPRRLGRRGSATSGWG